MRLIMHTLHTQCMWRFRMPYEKIAWILPVVNKKRRTVQSAFEAPPEFVSSESILPTAIILIYLFFYFQKNSPYKYPAYACRKTITLISFRPDFCHQCNIDLPSCILNFIKYSLWKLLAELWRWCSFLIIFFTRTHDHSQKVVGISQMKLKNISEDLPDSICYL